MDATPERSVGDAEAAGAISGMQESLGRKGGHAIGDSLWFQVCAGAMPRQGRVTGYGSGELLEVVDDAGQRHSVMPWQIAEF